MSSFDRLYEEIEREARAEGPGAVAELEALQLRYRLMADLLLLRKRRELTQTQLADLSGIPQSEISRIERGSVNPTVGTLLTLIRALGAELRLVDRPA